MAQSIFSGLTQLENGWIFHSFRYFTRGYSRNISNLKWVSWKSPHSHVGSKKLERAMFFPRLSAAPCYLPGLHPHVRSYREQTAHTQPASTDLGMSKDFRNTLIWYMTCMTYGLSCLSVYFCSKPQALTYADAVLNLWSDEYVPLVLNSFEVGISRAPVVHVQGPENRDRLESWKDVKSCRIWLWLTVCHGKSPFLIGKPR